MRPKSISLSMDVTLCVNCSIKVRLNVQCTHPVFKSPFWLVGGLSGCLWLFALKFREMDGTYEWCFIILWMQVQWWEYHGVMEIITPYHICKRISLNLLHWQMAGCKNFGHKCLCHLLCLDACSHAKATWWNFHYLIFVLPHGVLTFKEMHKH